MPGKYRCLCLGTLAIVLLGCGSAVGVRPKVVSLSETTERRVVTTPEPIPAPMPAPTSEPTLIPPPSSVPSSTPDLSPPVSTASPEVSKAVSAPPPPPPSPARFWNRLISDDGSLNTGVGIYSDCTGNTLLTHSEAVIDSCKPGMFFLGHNPGVFTPLMHLGVGSVVTWWDGGGVPHRFRMVTIRDWSQTPAYRAGPVIPPPPLPGSAAQFEVCITADGTHVRTLDAVPA